MRTRSSALPGWEKLSSLLQAVLCVSLWTPEGRASPSSDSVGILHRQCLLRKEPARNTYLPLTLLLIHIRYFTLRSCICTHAWQQFQGQTAVLETSPLHTPPQKYKNITRLVRRDTHLSLKSPCFILNSPLCHIHRNKLMIMVWCKVNGICHLSNWLSHWSSWASFPNCKMGNHSFLLEIICGSS